jgi:hypothetical protein
MEVGLLREWRLRMKPAMTLSGVFLISRLLYWMLGVRFDPSPLDSYLQLLDPILLKHDLLRSILYLREQPPGFNLLVGLLMKLAPIEPRHSFHALYLLIGLAIPLCLFELMTRLGIRERPALLAAAIFCVAPSTVLYENWLFYAYPILFLFILSALLLHRFVSRPDLASGVAFFGCLAVIWSFHAMFHPIWYALIATMLALAMKPRRRLIALAAGVPAALMLAVLIKNYVFFGDLAPGSKVVQRANYAIMSAQFTPPELIHKLVREGKITHILEMSIYEHPAGDYRDLVPEPIPKGIPALDQTVKSTGYANWNSSWMVDVAALYKKDAVTLRNYYPRGWYLNLMANVDLYFFPAEDVDPFTNDRHKNRLILDPIFHVYDYAISGQFRKQSPPWILWIVLPSALFFSIYRTLSWAWQVRRDMALWADASRLTVAFMTFNILYEAAATILVGCWDHNRYRDFVSGEYAVLIVLTIEAGRSYLGQRPRTDPV